MTGEIGAGLLVLLGVEKDDDEQKANRLCERVLGYRIFSDAEGKMNLNVQQAGAVYWWFPSLPLPQIPNGGCAQVSPKAHHRIAAEALYDYSSNAAVSKI
mgnify:CR=1 FL=1